MSRQLDLVVQGVLGTRPSVVRTATGRPFCHFRVATTPSFRSRDGWRDGATMWFTAKAWGALAENLGHSLHKGDPVVLVGRLSQETWLNETGEHLDNVLTVSCGGHDLTWGESRFMRVTHAEEEPDDPSGAAPGQQAPSAGAQSMADGAAGPAPEGAEDPTEPLPDSHWQVAEPPAGAGAPDGQAGTPQDPGSQDGAPAATHGGLDYVLVGQ